MASFNRQHVKAIASGIVVGTLFWFMGTSLHIVMPLLALNVEYGLFVLGFSAATAVTYSEASPPGEFKEAK